MEQLIHVILEWAQSQGIGVAMLLFALWWQVKSGKKVTEEKANEVKKALEIATLERAVADKERAARWQANDASIASLISRSDACETDRQRLSAQIFQLALRAGLDEASFKDASETQSK